MSNDYFEHPDTFIPGDLARAEDVENELKRVQTGFDYLPKPRPTGDGFLEPFFVEPPTQDGHVADWGTLKALEATAEQHKDDAETAKTGAETAETGAETAESGAITAKNDAQTAKSGAETAESNAQGHASNASSSATLASEWATKTSSTVDGSEYSAKWQAQKSKEWATSSSEVEPGLKSAKGYAQEAKDTVAGARVYIGYHDASSGNYPISSPSTGDEGKYWIIDVAGTLPLGQVEKGWELSINENLNYEAADLLPDNLVNEVNGQSGPTVTLSESDIGDIATTYVAQSSVSTFGGTLIDDADASTARSTLGLGSAATEDTGTGAGAIPIRDGNGDVPGDITGSAASATTATSANQADKWSTARTISLSGDLSGSASIDGSSNVSISATVSDDSHNHTISNVDGLQTALDGKLDDTAKAASASEADKWASARILSLGGDLGGSVTIDGTSNVTLSASVNNNSHSHLISNVSGLQSELDGKLDNTAKAADADKLDGVNGADYLKKSEFDPANATQVWTGTSTSIDFTTLSDSSPGLYGLRIEWTTTSGIQAWVLMYINETTTDAWSTTQLQGNSSDGVINWFGAWLDTSSATPYLKGVGYTRKNSGSVDEETVNILEIVKL